MKQNSLAENKIDMFSYEAQCRDIFKHSLAVVLVLGAVLCLGMMA